MRQMLVALLLTLSPTIALGQVPFPKQLQTISSFSFEAKDWGIEATATPKRSPYHAPTPTSISGGRVIKTLELKALLDNDRSVVVIDVLESKTRNSVPGAFRMFGAGGGEGDFFAAEKSRFATALEKISNRDKTRPIVFLCLNSECWLSYNASLHAIEAGYKDVIWYRGGTDAWTGASFEWTPPQSVSW